MSHHEGQRLPRCQPDVFKADAQASVMRRKLHPLDHDGDGVALLSS
jgi:hypothetical protein